MVGYPNLWDWDYQGMQCKYNKGIGTEPWVTPILGGWIREEELAKEIKEFQKCVMY